MVKKLLIIAFSLSVSLTYAATEIPAGATYETGFSPHRGAQTIILDSIAKAKAQILVAAYTFTSKPISLALLAAHKRGVEVYVVADKKANTKYTAAHFLANEGVPIRLNGRYAIHHHKFMIIDFGTLELGSFNFSAAAHEKNAENVLILHNVRPLADEYRKEWNRLWDEGESLEKAY